MSKWIAESLSHSLGVGLLHCRGMSPRLQLHAGAGMPPVWLERGKCLEPAMLNETLIAIVDDDELYRESMRKLVTSMGYAVEAFPSAADFLTSCALPQTGCLIADVHMPGMSGIQLHKHLIESGYAIPTIVVTAYPDEIVRDRALKDGIVCYLAKPVDDRHLEQCLHSALQPATSIGDNS